MSLYYHYRPQGEEKHCLGLEEKQKVLLRHFLHHTIQDWAQDWAMPSDTRLG